MNLRNLTPKQVDLLKRLLRAEIRSIRLNIPLADRLQPLVDDLDEAEHLLQQLERG